MWRPDIYGSTLFLVASVFALLAVGAPGVPLRPWSAVIAWINMVGSIFFMASAIGSYVLPKTGELVDQPLAVGGTLLGAVCFLLGALLMLPAWRVAVRTATPGTHSHVRGTTETRST